MDRFRLLTDDLGGEVHVPGAAGRVISLVPSITEALAADRADALVGATDWCTHPADLEVARVRGTKNPDLAKIVDLRPDLVVVNQEENRELDVQRLRERGVPVWVTVIESLDQAFSSLRRLYAEALGWGVPQWLQDAEQVWAQPTPGEVRALVPIWRDPWMVVGHPTFTADLLGRAGVRVVSPPGRYPHLDLDRAVAELKPDLVLLPSEPYEFTAVDGPEAFPATPTALIDGRAITWYGPSLLTARELVARAVNPT